MKLTADAQSFAREAAWAARWLPARAPVPVLAGMKLDADNGALNLTCFDYDVSARTEVGTDTAETGSVVLPGRLLAQAAAELPPGPLILTADGAKAVVKAGSVRFTLPTLPLEDYPTPPACPQEIGRVNPDSFAEGIARTAIAAAAPADCTSNTFALSGVHLVCARDTLRLEATDRYRVARTDLDWTPAALDACEADVTIDARTLATAARTMDGEKLILGLDPAADYPVLGLTAAGRTLTARALDTEYTVSLDPLLGRATKADATASTDTGRLLQAVRRAALATWRGGPIHLELTPHALEVRGGCGDDAAAHDTAPADLDGPAQLLALNAQYLTDALSAQHCDTVALHVIPGPGPVPFALLTPGDAPDTYRHMIISLRTTDSPPR